MANGAAFFTGPPRIAYVGKRKSGSFQFETVIDAADDVDMLVVRKIDLKR